ncbi:tyrosine-type recombinase/integrase [Sphingobacterium rhinopitheci]|uniref:tyrosine-type recombinase/integrase n=1 Tax=Sphingobacterium rhinopitheci TaxID=2781960 RepID=UPI001F527B15|nr:site-specific integrase [Sphingobacterium rhinopitheci]MCI0922282.1 site-specific integrase [Sphingobacterium rhinopitheci]
MTRVELRKRKRDNGRLSLFLDYYPPIKDMKSGKEKRQEFLKLYIWEKPKGQAEKDFNKSVLATANEILANRINQIRKEDIYSPFEKERLKLKEIGDQDFIEYFKILTRKKKDSNRQTWKTVLMYLEEYFTNGLKFSDIDERTINGFKEYLLTAKSIKSDKTTLAQNTALSYFNKVKESLKQAFKDGFLQVDINGRVDPIKAEETRREFLTIEELQRLVNTPCNDDVLKRASLFSALTGLRFSDIVKLKGNEVNNDSTGYYLTFTQQKTKGVENHYISEQAYNLLGDFDKDDSQVFKGLKYSAYSNKHLAQWIGASGITKNITFHNFRHTYATLQLDNGTDIYTVSKLLGHKSVKTTQIYTKVLDDKKREAANKIKLNF